MVQIDLWNKGSVRHERLYELLEPHVERLEAIMNRNYPNSKNSMDWVFLRKYEAATPRKGLKAHTDSNEHSMNVALNTDFEGGSLFFIRQDGPLGARQKSSNDEAVQFFNVPQGTENTTDYFYPYMETGSAYVHGKTLWHGITTITEGTKYSLLFFFDEPRRTQAVSPKIKIHNQRDKTIGVYWKAKTRENASQDVVEIFTLLPGDIKVENTHIGHEFVALDYESKTFIDNVVVLDKAGDKPVSWDISNVMRYDPDQITEKDFNIITISDLEEKEAEDEDMLNEHNIEADPKEETVVTAQVCHAGEDACEKSGGGPTGRKLLWMAAAEEVVDAVDESTPVDVGSDAKEPITLWGYDVRPFLEDEDGKPNLVVIGTLALISLATSLVIIVFVLPVLNEQERARFEAEEEAKKKKDE
ncbi:hypothetical protein AAMO2058_001442800 [Amorphochlora amoebiformis]